MYLLVCQMHSPYNIQLVALGRIARVMLIVATLKLWNALNPVRLPIS